LAKFLLIRFSSIGDIVLTSPIIRGIKTQIPSAEIHYLTKKSYESLVLSNPYLDKVFTFTNSLSKTILELQKENYTCVIDLHKNLRSAQIVLALRKSALSFDKLNIEKWMAVSLKVNKLPSIHLVDRYFNALSKLGIKNDGKGLDYFFQKNFQAISLPESFHKPYLAWAIGGTHFTKRFPAHKIKDILSKLPYPCVLLGGQEDAEQGNLIGDNLSHVLNLCGKCSLDQSAELVKNAQLVLSNDTGMMHIAAAFRKPSMVFWGNTIPKFGMYPYQESQNISNFEINELSCRPCSKLGFPQCPKKHFKCMENLSNLTIQNEIMRRMAI
jgi:ADP-heptose:LPS heptosyltransferase